MMTAMLFTTLFAPEASAVTRDLKLCARFKKEFSDAEAGDWWTDNDDNAIARGVRMIVTDDVGPTSQYASDTTGCATFQVDVSSPDYEVAPTITSEAEVSGVYLHSYEPDTSTAWDTGSLGDTTRAQAQWDVPVTSDPTEYTPALPLGAEWEDLAALTMVFRRSDFNITTSASRDCCSDDQATGYDKDGTCPNPDYQAFGGPVRIYHDPDAGCGGSSVNGEPALALLKNSTTGSGCGRKFLVPHEGGHVTVRMRMSGRTQDQDRDVLENGCDGSNVAQNTRGRFSKEYVSVALREGWGDFVAQWTWNKRTESDCVYQGIGATDFNLDGTNDNDDPNDPFYRQDDCRGTPYMAHDTAAPMDDVNWLDDLQDTAYVDHCDRHSSDVRESNNRSTVYDVAKMFWQLNNTNGQGILIEDLADLYVDMCPREWAMNDDEAIYGPYVEDDLPLERLKISASHHGLTTELNAVIDHVEH